MTSKDICYTGHYIDYELLENIEKIHEEYLGYRDSARAAFEQMSIFAPNTAANISEQVANFDVDKLQEISNIASQLN